MNPIAPMDDVIDEHTPYFYDKGWQKAFRYYFYSHLEFYFTFPSEKVHQESFRNILKVFPRILF